MEKIFKVEGMRCEHCSARVEKTLTALGFETAISIPDGEVKVIAEKIDDAEVKNAIEDLGFIVK